MDQNIVLLKSKIRRISQRIVSEKKSNKRNVPRLYNIKIKGEKVDADTSVMNVWFWKALCFLRIRDCTGMKPQCTLHRKKNIQNFSSPTTLTHFRSILLPTIQKRADSWWSGSAIEMNSSALAKEPRWKLELNLQETGWTLPNRFHSRKGIYFAT